MSRLYTKRFSSFIPSKSVLAETLVEEAHLQLIHRGATLTMARVRYQNWIPTLRQLVKRIITKSVRGGKNSTLVIIQNHHKY